MENANAPVPAAVVVVRLTALPRSSVPVSVIVTPGMPLSNASFVPKLLRSE